MTVREGTKRDDIRQNGKGTNNESVTLHFFIDFVECYDVSKLWNIFHKQGIMRDLFISPRKEKV